MKGARILALAVLVTALAGCAVGPNYRTPKTPTPEGFAAGSTATAGAGGNAPATAAPVDFTAWWHALNDPELDSLIARAISGNPDVLIALDRLQAARTFEAAIIGTVLPEAGAAIGAGRGTGSDLTRGRAPSTLRAGDDSADLKQINVVGGFDALWELD
ncbi:MAG TPA: hypothetical protein VF764_08590, partial [Steroidobacteraceae bacterium]